VKGIDPKAREIAKDLARREGLTLGDWINRRIMEGPAQPPAADAVDPPSARGGKARASAAPPAFAADELSRLKEALDRIDARVETAEQRSSVALTGIDQTVLGVLSRLEAAEREQVSVSARFEGALQEIRADQVQAEQRMAKAEDAAAHPKSVEALRALEGALGKVASHLYDSESRTRESLAQMRADLGGLQEQVGHMDGSELGPSQVMIDAVVARIVQRLEEAEARTSGAIRGLEASVSDFDRRLLAAEGAGGAPDQRLQQLAQDLARNFEAAEGRFEAQERSLREIAGQVQAAEQRSTQAMEKMGREVLRVAETLGRRMEGVETRSAQAVQMVGGEVSRIADAMEGRVRKADQIQAESLERLGAEIARITERLAERVGAAERRSAQAIDDVGEQVSRITDKLNQRHERASADLAERIRQSEERTARLLEEAREKLDQRLAGAERRLTDQPIYQPASPPAPSAVIDPGTLFADSDLPPGPFEAAAAALDREMFAPESFAPAMFSATPEPRPQRLAPAGFVPPVESLPQEPERSPFEGDDFDVASMFESFNAEAQGDAADDESAFLAEAEEGGVEDDLLDEPAEGFQAAGPAKASTRELIEQARAAARAAAQDGEGGRQKKSLFAGFGLGAKKARKAESSILKSAMMMAAALAVLGVGTAAVTLYTAQSVDHPRAKSADAGVQILPGRATSGEAAAPQAAVALTASIAPAAGGVDLASLYGDAVRRLEAKDQGGLSDLRRAAGLGYGPAQFYLAKLYEEGHSGAAKDPVEARRWTERAAENGERGAMHNLALYYFEGIGGPKNATAAGEWFRKAAQRGLVDSQFNLAKLYEGGFGMAENPAEAYKWYLIAARSGDGESRNAAQRLKGRLSADARQTAERAAQAFRADPGAVASTAGRSPGA
jgi:localization factor PodJL